MPRIARVIAKGYPHHVTQRGNYQQLIFEDEDMRKNSLTNRPCGDDVFIETIEGLLGRKLKALD